MAIQFLKNFLRATITPTILLGMSVATISCTTQEEELGDFTAQVATGPQHIIPHPDPVVWPGPDIRTSVGWNDEIRPILVIGLKKTVPGGEYILIKGSSAEIKTKATMAGSFAATIMALGDETLSISYNNALLAQVTIPAMSSPGGTSHFPNPGPGPELPRMTRHAPGLIAIEGSVYEKEGAKLLGINLSNGEISDTLVRADSTFRLDLMALPGNGIEVCVDDGPTLKQCWYMVAP